MDEPMAGTTLSGDEWEQAQYLPGASVATAPFGPDDPKKKKPAVPNTTNLGRVLTGDEWEQAQTQSGPQVKALQIPRLPTLAKPAAEATANPLSPKSKGKALAPFNLADPTTYANPVLRQIVNPALDNPIQTAVTVPAFGIPGVGHALGAVMAGSMVHSIASYGWQKAAESQLSPEDRARAEADPERISGESAAVQAAMLGLAPLIHVGVKAMQGPSYGAGMLEAGASGVHETMADPAVAAERTAPFQGELNAAHAAYLEQGAATTRIPADVPKPAGFAATAGGATLKTTPRAVAGLIAPESATPGKVKPLATVPVGEFQDATKIVNESGANALSGIDMSTVRSNAAIRRRNGGELTLSEARSEAADAIAKADRFRPRSGPANLFETEQGAQILGAAAARHAMPETANPYHPDSPLATEWDAGHAAGTEATARAQSAAGHTSAVTPEPSAPIVEELPPDATHEERTAHYAEAKRASDALPVGTVVEDAQGIRYTKRITHINGKEVHGWDDGSGPMVETAHPVIGGRIVEPSASPPAGPNIPAMETVPHSEWSNISGQDEPDAFLYHVTSEPNASRILNGGFASARRLMGQAGANVANSRGRVFFTERPGVSFWSERAEQHLSDQFDEPPAVAVLRIPKAAIADLIEPDQLGSTDARSPAFAVDAKKLQERMAEGAQPETPAAGQPAPATSPTPSPAPPSEYSTLTTDELRGLVAEARAVVDRGGKAVGRIAFQNAQHRLDRITRELASREAAASSYPDGFSMGGALTDNRIPGAEELPKRARGIDAPPATEEQALASALKPPPIPDEPARGLASVEGTGETKTRGLSAGVQEKAVANTLTNTLGDLPEYRTVNMADQATRASDLLSSDYALARRVALGEVNAPAGLLPEAVFTAVENRAIAEGDVATIRDLATGGLTTEATTMGQRIRALAERDPDSPVSAISRVVDARSGGVENVDAQTAKLTAQIKKHLDKIKLPEDALVKLLDSLRC